jgi:hypothetical protein
MLDDRLVVTAINVQPDNGIQRNTYAYKLEHLVQESSVAISKHQFLEVSGTGKQS